MGRVMVGRVGCLGLWSRLVLVLGACSLAGCLEAPRPRFDLAVDPGLQDAADVSPDVEATGDASLEAGPACTGPAECDDGKECTLDQCNAATGCSNVLQADWCLIGGACYANGQLNPTNPCQACDPSRSTTSWSVLVDWATCRAGQVCKSGTCTSVTCPAGYVLVPSGTFTMGSPEGEPGRNEDEGQHQVTISRAFCLKETEVTQDEWQSVMGNKPSGAGCSTCPVEAVTWWDAVAYCNELSSREKSQQCYTLTGCSGTPGAGNFKCTGVTFVGLTCTGYRLPTESEWEYAARAGTTGGTYKGTSALIKCELTNEVLNSIAWFCGNSEGPMPVKEKHANAWGLYDMLGNVWEWVWDWYGPYPAGTVTDPTGAATGKDRVGRGGSWRTDALGVRAAVRVGVDPDARSDDLGFRPARSGL